MIEGGINDSAAGRRYSDATDYEKYLRYYIDSCQAFGLDVVISSGTSSGTIYTEAMKKVAPDQELGNDVQAWRSYADSVVGPAPAASIATQPGDTAVK